MSSRFELTQYYNTCYTSPFLNKSGAPLVCFHEHKKIKQQTFDFFKDRYFLFPCSISLNSINVTS